MKPTLWIAGACFAFALTAAAQSLDDQYVRIYSTIQQGDLLLDARQGQAASDKFLEAEAGLKKIQAAYPTWNERVIAFRLRYVAEKLSEARTFTTQAPAPARPVVPQQPIPTPRPAAPTVAAPAPVVPAPTVDTKALTAPYEKQIRSLQTEKANLEAKLREALTAQPAAVDPKEFAKSQDRVRLLQKENDILRVSLTQEKERSAQADPATVAQIRNALADSTSKLVAQAEQILSLRKENADLQTKVTNNPELAKLRNENQSLQKEVTDLRLNSKLTTAAGDLARQFAEAKTQLVVQNARIETLNLEKAAIENRLRELSKSPTSTPAPAPPPGLSINDARTLNDKIVLLERQLGESRQSAADAAKALEQLQKDKSALVAQVAQYALDAANTQPAPKSADTTKVAPSKTSAVDTAQLTERLGVLRARLDIFEARPVPYTADELALFKTPAKVAVADPNAGRKSARVLPSGAATLVAQAERAFNERRLDEAARLYQQAVQLDTKNVYTLANLAAIQIEKGDLKDADGNLVRALAESPNDAYSLSLMGIAKFRQDKFEDAMDFLGRAAQLEPNNAETQNYLGVALSQKGQRAAAETALRKAVQLSPGYASAHHNLAVVYATAQPPSVELARFHYTKALGGGHPKNEQLENMLNGKPGAAN